MAGTDRSDPLPLPGRLLEAAGNRRPREMIALDRTRLTGPLRFCLFNTW